jgi:hypothetical protein
MPDDTLPEPFDGSGTILTEKRRKLLIEGDLDVSESTIRRHKQEIRERFVDSLIDLYIIANTLDISDMKSLGETIDKRESEYEEPVFKRALKGLVAIGWMIGEGTGEQIEGAVSEGIQLGEKRIVPYRRGKIPQVYPDTAIEFGYGSAYWDPKLEPLISLYEENPEDFSHEASVLMEKTLREMKTNNQQEPIDESA